MIIQALKWEWEDVRVSGGMIKYLTHQLKTCLSDQGEEREYWNEG